MQTTIGGDRLGSGNKQETSFKNYERSTHDLSFLWRSSMASGTLVPFMNEIALPGDNFEIDLDCEVLTLPTIGPLFGSYKVQLDVFEVPMRLYNAKLHMNKLGVGMDMSQIYLPQMEVLTYNDPTKKKTWKDNEQVNPSSLIKYLGVSGIGSFDQTEVTVNPVKRYFNAVPLLAVWEIYKNYYSNKQEEKGYYIHTDSTIIAVGQTPLTATAWKKNGALIGDILTPTTLTLHTGDFIEITFPAGVLEPDPSTLIINIASVATSVKDAFDSTQWFEGYRKLRATGLKSAHNAKVCEMTKTPGAPMDAPRYFFGLKSFPLENIDTMRMQILQYTGNDAFKITPSSLEPYSGHLKLVNLSDGNVYSSIFSQESLPIKTYQSDLFNNWINTEWIDGTGGITDLTAVSTATGEFTIDALNIATKVYEMLNRIAVSGGTYDNWLEAVYTHERVKGVESPVYCGSLIKELGFQEVVSNALTIDTTDDNRKAPLGTLAGRGKLTGKNKGGKVQISVNEPSYIIGLVSLTPRIEYSQGNAWHMNLKTYDDFHKPALDAIGFQDLITDQMLWSDTQIYDNAGMVVFRKLGKQPAWVNYMTNVNKCFGAFAQEDNSQFMVLNRRYEKNPDGTLKDGTTYIDPTKFNNIFAEVALDAQNFWVQIACNITARRKMSAKVIPNL